MSSKKLNRRARGFSLLEALTAGVCLILGLLGVTVLVQQIGRAASQADFNVQATKLGDQMLAQTLGVGYAQLLGKVGLPPEPCNGVLVTQFPSGQTYQCTVAYQDTSGAGPLPLLGQPSIHVIVTIERVPIPLLNPQSRQYIVEGYAIPSS